MAKYYVVEHEVTIAGREPYHVTRMVPTKARCPQYWKRAMAAGDRSSRHIQSVTPNWSSIFTQVNAVVDTTMGGKIKSLIFIGSRNVVDITPRNR